MKATLLAASLACAAVLLPTHVAADATTDDVHCYMVSTQLLASDDATAKISGTFGALYFMGKLYGRTPDINLENLILAELPNMQGAFPAEAKRCGEELAARGKEQTQLGRDLQQKGADMMQKENSK